MVYHARPQGGNAQAPRTPERPGNPPHGAAGRSAAGNRLCHVALWGTWWVVIPYLIYAVLYGTSSDSRWHECGHGTAFKTDWMNSVLYEIASFMVMRESVVWRWSHNRHHSDTIIVGRDPEIQIPRPPDLRGLILSIFNVAGYRTYFPSLFRHALGSHVGGRDARSFRKASSPRSIATPGSAWPSTGW